MNQKPQKSQTTQILYQEPTQAEMNPSFKDSAFSTLQNVSLIVIIATVFIFTTLTILHGCADDVDRQHAMAVKHQLQFGGVK